MEERILAGIAKAWNLETLWRPLVAFMGKMGFGGIAYYRLHTESHLPVAIPLSEGFPRALLDTYASFDFQRLDVVPRAALAGGRPVSWLQIWQTMQLTPAERELYCALDASGMQDGYALPCYGPEGRNAVISIGLMDAGADLSGAAISRLHYVAEAAHLRVCTLFSGHETLDRRLSNREREILDWVARGKSNAAIAEILEIAPGTVDTYIRRIYEKLDVSDRTSAAVKGVGLGLIAA